MKDRKGLFQVSETTCIWMFFMFFLEHNCSITLSKPMFYWATFIFFREQKSLNYMINSPCFSRENRCQTDISNLPLRLTGSLATYAT